MKVEIEWIPVSDRKPTMNRNVLAVWSGGVMAICYFVKFSDGSTRWESEEGVEIGDSISKPTHWAALPKGPHRSEG